MARQRSLLRVLAITLLPPSIALVTLDQQRARSEPGQPAIDRPASAARIDFARQIRPILSENCFRCHGPDDKERKAGLRLDVKEKAFAELKSGNRAIVPGKSDESEL